MICNGQATRKIHVLWLTSDRIELEREGSEPDKRRADPNMNYNSHIWVIIISVTKIIIFSIRLRRSILIS